MSSLRVIANKVSDTLWASHPRRFAPDCRFASLTNVESDDLRGTKQIEDSTELIQTYRSFSLMGRNRRIKAKMNGPPHSRPKCLTLRSRSTFCEGKRQAPLGEGQAFSSSLGQAPLPFWPGPRAHPGRVLAFPHTVPVVFTFTLNDTLPPQTIMADRDPPSLTPPEDYIPRRRFASSRTK